MASSRQILESLSQLGDWGDCGQVALNAQPGVEPKKPAARISKIDRRRAALARTIEGEIIPRLMLAHGSGRHNLPMQRPREFKPSDEDVREFARLLVAHDVTVAAAYIEAMRTQGASLEMLLLELIAPAARLLGEYWKSDVRDFTDVTVGLARMHRLLHDLSPEFEQELAAHQATGRVLLAATPGEQHTLGILIVEEFFRRAGWDVWGGTFLTADEIINLSREERVDVIGLSLSCEILFENLASVIQAVRKTSRNRSVRIIVGGNLFLENPDLVARCGADGTALDAKQAVMRLPNLLALRG